MAINSEFYTDAKGAQAHAGFLLLMILTFLSKDSLSTSQTISIICSSIAIPMLIVALTLTLNDKDDLEKVGAWQIRTSIITLSLGHFFGLTSVSFSIGSLSATAGALFFLSSTIALFIFCQNCYKSLNPKGREALENLIFGE